MRYFEVEIAHKDDPNFLRPHEADLVNGGKIILIKGEHHPSREEAAVCLREEMKKEGFDAVYSITEITREEVDKYYSNVPDSTIPVLGEKEVWVVGICCSEAEGVATQKVYGTEDEVMAYLLSLVIEDRKVDPDKWDMGTESVEEVYSEVYAPSKSLPKKANTLYAYGNYSDYHIDYTAIPERVLEVKDLTEYLKTADLSYEEPDKEMD